MEKIWTKWHHIMPLVAADQVYLPAPEGGKARHWSEFDPEPEKLRELVRLLSPLPKYTVDPELMEIASKEKFQHSVLDLQKAGVLRLPYRAMLVEFGNRIVLLRDNSQQPGEAPWEAASEKNDFYRRPFYGFVFTFCNDTDGHYLVISPSVVSFKIEERDGEPWLGVSSDEHDILVHSDDLVQTAKSTFLKQASTIWKALLVATLLIHTEGVDKRVIECKKLNKKRATQKKELVPRHTYLYIGRVYKHSGNDSPSEVYTRRSPCPHWRRGHLRNIRYGEGKKLAYAKFFPARLVAYKDWEGEEPPAKEYHVKL